MSEFKEMLEEDIYGTFLNMDEFAETHRIEGSDIPVVVDNDALNKLKVKEGTVLGFSEADLLVIGKESDFPSNMDAGRLLNVDGREMIVVKAEKDMGVITVTLRQNRTG